MKQNVSEIGGKQSINFTQVEYDLLKRRYLKAVAAQEEIFEFQGIELCTKFAKYVLEYLDPIFG